MLASSLQHSVILFRCAMSYEGGKMLTYYTYESISNTRIFALLAATKHINLQQQNTQIHLPQHALVRLAAAMAMPSCGLPHCVQCGLRQHEFVRLAAAVIMRSCGLPQQWPCPRAACRIAFSAACRNMNSCGLPQHTFVRLAAAMIMRSCGLPQQWPCARAACRNMNSCGLPQQ
jgi:hypothetical protein